ncbi:CgeB family protein [Hydrogenophaga sp.]|uniref:CgeB family protein n=1 Tax=Hydrogenophaga sp. TaxID=1904254 RepID=UPI003D0F7FB4
MKILCAFGQYNYGDVKRGESPEFSAFLPALRNLGHEVRLVETWNRRAYLDLASLNRALLDAVEDFRPDVLLSVQMNYEIWLETLELIRARGDVITLSWATDDSWKYREVSRFIAGSYDAMATTYDHVVPRYRSDGFDHVLATQWAAISDHLQEPLPAQNCRYPVSFIGTSHGSRIQRVEALRARGIKVVCFGHGWPNGPVAAEDMPRIIRESCISLNFANSQGENQIKARLFEVPGAGGFLLTEPARSLEKYYRADQEIAVFADLDDLVAKINHYLAHPQERDRIAQAGFQRTRQEHTYEHRFIQLLRFARTSAPARSHARSAMPFQEAAVRHRLTPPLRLLRNILMRLGGLVFGKEKGAKAARRLVYELSWRLVGRHTFTASGWPGRMFPHD